MTTISVAPAALAPDGRVDLFRVELAALLVHRIAARDLGPLDDPGDPLHVADHVDAHRGRHRTIRPVTAAIRIGTCSWADEALVKHWYPRGMRSAEERLRYYAERFSTVEVDSTYYPLPAPEVRAGSGGRSPAAPARRSSHSALRASSGVSSSSSPPTSCRSPPRTPTSNGRR